MTPPPNGLLRGSIITGCLGMQFHFSSIGNISKRVYLLMICCRYIVSIVCFVIFCSRRLKQRNLLTAPYLRAVLARRFSEVAGPLGYRESENFRNSSEHSRLLERIDSTIACSSEVCIVHLKNSYGIDQIPLWALVEVETFGVVTKLYEKCKSEIQSSIAADYHIGARPLRSYLQHLRVLRNFCAHHARMIWRRFYGFSPFVEWSDVVSPIDTRTLFCQFLFVYRLLKHVPAECFDRDDWKHRVCANFTAVPVFASGVDLLSLMHVPSNPIESSLWV